MCTPSVVASSGRLQSLEPMVAVRGVEGLGGELDQADARCHQLKGAISHLSPLFQSLKAEDVRRASTSVFYVYEWVS